ncbi:Uncharacterised protein [Legionella bozemanae]|uniref:Inverse autotransporter beta-domain domain-containing protein n=1 Tax=Legionella bozemanae TaxID=447 RepID=A0A0W0R6Q2_LEGBO|nr:hypothetical protein [Legionella bozemanae]KTC66720.1 hypothetical protein Lboz_3615 [Legionella bozemanae]STO33490.1 Uncharacterised protein [Legionella bozemanae]
MKRLKQKASLDYLKLFVAVIIILGFNTAYPGYQPWSTRVTGQGLLGKSQIGGFIDGMQPLTGNTERLWFIDGTILGGSSELNSSNSAYSIGTGVRELKNWSQGEAILGGFFFADYQQTAHRTQAWIANPGIELLGSYNEVRVQGYIPISRRHQTYHYLMASDIPQSTLNDSGRTNNLTYVQGHGFFDTPAALTDEYGVGLEAELGHYLPLPQGGWIHGGVYYFNYQNAKNITGVEANVELFTGKNAALVIQENYDNQNKNKISLGVRFSFGGPDYTQAQNLSNRMEEPIIRHLARPSYGLATPTRKSFIATGSAQEIRNNIWFFSPEGTYQGHGSSFTFANCTAENPCINLDQTVASGIAAVAPNASFWFASGTYVLPSTGTDGFIQLADGQSLWGRNADFMAPAMGSQLPTIRGGIWWNGNSSINDLQLINNNQIIPQTVSHAYDNTVMGVGATGNVTLNNTRIITSATGSLNDTAIFSVYSYGENILINSSHVLGIGDATYTGYVDTVVSDGVEGATGNVIINNSYIESRGNGSQQNNGILGGNGDTVINNSVVNVSGRTIIGSTGVFSYNNVTINSSKITVEDDTDIITPEGLGGVYGASSGGDVFIKNSLITAINNGASFVHAVDSFNSTVINSKITAVGRQTGDVIGIYDYVGGAIETITHSTIRAESSGGGAASGINAPTGQIIFTGVGASQIFASSSVSENAQAIMGMVSNESSPKSQCTTNGGHEHDCA